MMALYTISFYIDPLDVTVAGVDKVARDVAAAAARELASWGATSEVELHAGTPPISLFRASPDGIEER